MKPLVLITGAAGYVASELIPTVKKSYSVVGIDRRPSERTDKLFDIGMPYFSEALPDFRDRDLIIVHLAAARFDFGAVAADYYKKNVSDQLVFLNHLDQLRVKKIVHVSSVAAIDGRHIAYSDELSCDDAYRSTKYLQEKMIEEWCIGNEVKLVILYPSAIFSPQQRLDTNIGKLIKIIQYLPFIPDIPVKKSLTYLPSFCDFIYESIPENLIQGKYLTIESPVQTVSSMIQLLSRRTLRKVSIPYLREILYGVSYFLYVLGGFGRLDTKLTPNRVKKLFSDTSYSNFAEIDTKLYASRSQVPLSKILTRIVNDSEYVK